MQKGARVEFNEFFVGDDSWELAVKKQFIYPDREKDVKYRVKVAGKRHELDERVIPYEKVSLSPLFLKLEPAANRIGRRVQYTTLTRGVSESVARRVVMQLAETMALLHSVGVVHGYTQLSLLRQEKEKGTLLLLGHCLPLSLFALHTPFAEEMRQLAAPEVQQLRPFTEAADVWSLGVVLLQLLTKPDTMFCSDDLVDMNLLSPWVSPLSPSAKTFVMQCFKEDPTSRPTIVELLQHPFINVDTALNDQIGKDETTEHHTDMEEPSSEEEEEEEETDESSSD